MTLHSLQSPPLHVSKEEKGCVGLMLGYFQLPLKTVSTPKSPPHLYKVHIQEQTLARFFSLKSHTTSVTTVATGKT